MHMKTFGISNGDEIKSASRFFAMLMVAIGFFALALHFACTIQWPVHIPIPTHDSIFNNIHYIA